LKTPLLLCHGTDDQVVNPKFADMSYRVIKDLDMDVVFKKYEGVGHSTSEEELSEVQDWIVARIPDTAPDIPLKEEKTSQKVVPKTE
jgi:predicted esterase